MRNTTKRWRAISMYGLLAAVLVAVGLFLMHDLSLERERVLKDTALQAEQKSQILGRSFGDTFLAADYVLRDILGHVGGNIDAKALSTMTPLLTGKRKTVSGVLDLSVFDKECIFRAFALNHQFAGKRSKQRLCDADKHLPGESRYIEYIPPEKAANGKPSILMSRVVATEQGQMLVGAAAVISLEYAQQWIGAFEAIDDDTLTLVDTDGVIFARKPFLASAIGQHTSTPPGQPRFADIQGSTHFVAVAPTDQRRRVYGLSRAENMPFIVVVGVSEERTLSNWHHRNWQFWLGYTVLVALSIWLMRSHLHTLQQHQEMERLATTDSLTGIANRRQFMTLAEHEAKRARRHNLRYSVMMLDIDHFKSVNDRWGHPTGDRAICAVARAMEQAARAADVLARLGGEEFVLLLPDTATEGATAIAERLRGIVEANTEVRSDDGSVVRFSVSIGVATRTDDETQFDPILVRADQALYQAKTQGRNRVVVA